MSIQNLSSVDGLYICRFSPTAIDILKNKVYDCYTYYTYYFIFPKFHKNNPKRVITLPPIQPRT